MELTFEYSQYICDGGNPTGFHWKDQEFFVAYVDGGGTKQYVKAGTPYGYFDGLTFTDPATAIINIFNDYDVARSSSYSYSGEEHWIVWRKNEPDHEHRIAKYLWRQVFILSARQVVEEELIRLNWQLQWQLFDPG